MQQASPSVGAAACRHTLAVARRVPLLSRCGQRLTAWISAIPCGCWHAIISRGFPDARRPKLLDFGIAKLLRPDENTLALTETVSNALTPACAAPEQLYGEAITTATDVFALGLILFQLIAGDLPEQRRRRNIEALQVDLDADIDQRPSQVLRRFEDDAVLAEPSPILAREVQGDLDAIMLMALRRAAGRAASRSARCAASNRADHGATGRSGLNRASLSLGIARTGACQPRR